MLIGILALQGDFQAHQKRFSSLGVKTLLIKSPHELENVDGLVIPGGESTTLSKLMDSLEFFDKLFKLISEGLPTLATCAGMILLAKEVSGATKNQRFLSLLDIGLERNAYGSQLESFECDIDIRGITPPKFHAVFIRAPKVTKVGPGVEVLANVDDVPVMVKQKSIAALSFHPELTEDIRIHNYFLEIVKEK